MAVIVHRLRITINGHAYDVTVEDLDAADASGAARPVAVPAAETQAAPAPSAAPSSPPSGPPAAPAAAPRAGEVRAPLPGVVNDIKVRTGQAVEAGQTLLVLEAMKMDNEVPAPRAAVVREVRVAKGEQVSADQVLVVLG